MEDRQIIKHLTDLCKFGHKMEGEACVELSFHDDKEILGGTIRRHPLKKEIVEIISRMTNLRHLDLRKCKIGCIPKIASRQLQHVDLSCNDLENVPEWISQQSGLKFLNLGANNLLEIPDLSALPIESLKLHKNKLARMPKVDKTIKSLNIFLSGIDLFPTEILDLYLLEVLTFGVTRAKSVGGLASLPNLRWLTLTVNKIETLPDDICSLKKLEGLQLAKNHLMGLPDRIGELDKLKYLTLYSNRISQVPESFFDLKLRKLNLALNPIEGKERLLKVFGDIDFIRI